MLRKLARYFPVLEWGRLYSVDTFVSDFVAAMIVTIMLVPQSLAYAMLAGLPPQMGLYASILPLLFYAILGTSRTLAIGPVAILSLMTAAAAGNISQTGSIQYIEAAIILAILSGFFLFLMGVFRIGFLANFLSHPVISGFITASGVIIAASQLKHILGVESYGHNLREILLSLSGQITLINIPTLSIGVLVLIFLLSTRRVIQPLLENIGVPKKNAMILTRATPVLVVIFSIVIVVLMDLDKAGVKVLGDVPRTLPTITYPAFDFSVWRSLIGSAALISLIGFVESISVAQALAVKRRQRVDPNQELIGLGVANFAAGISGGYPVTGGLARSAVNFEAGAQTPAAGAFTAIGIALAALFLTPYLYYLPKAALAGMIIFAVVSLIDIPEIFKVWRYSKTDFTSMAGTIFVTLGYGIELGVVTGVTLSLFLHLYNTSRPHFAIVGQIPGTQHFRNINRYDVVTSRSVLAIRVDESLYFANARFLEDTVSEVISGYPALAHLILMCPAVNHIDASALESLENINHRLQIANIQLHLSEVKGPVMDKLQHTHFLKSLTGSVYLNQFEALRSLDRVCAVEALERNNETTEPHTPQERR